MRHTLAAFLITILVASPIWARKDDLANLQTENNATARAAINGTALHEQLVFSAAPYETPEVGRQIYQPIAEYLSAVIGQPVVYKHPGTWGVYLSEMRQGSYDLIFDGPHFSSWRARTMQYNVLAKIPGNYQFLIAVRKQNKNIHDIKQLAGQTLCGHHADDPGMQMLLAEFDNPARQPVLIPTRTWQQSYENLIRGNCTGAMLPSKSFDQYDSERKDARVIYESGPIPNEALSAGPRITPEQQDKIRGALMADAALAPTKMLRQIHGARFAPATNQEYETILESLPEKVGLLMH